MPTRLILQFAVAIEVVNKIALGLDQRKLDLVAEIDQLLVTYVAVAAVIDNLEPVALRRANRPDNGFRRVAFVNTDEGPARCRAR